MEALHIGSRREVCWDEYLMDTSEGIRVQMHKPEFRGEALHCTKPWEGDVCTYFTLLRDEEHYRLYYLGLHHDFDEFGHVIEHDPYLCYAESHDGKTFHRVYTRMCEHWGTKENNIICDDIYDNMYIYKDTNPDCPPQERYKGFAQGRDHEHGLWLYTSADGIHFEKARLLCDDGAYDSMNVCFWDRHTRQYFLFYRGLHGPSITNGKWDLSGVPEEERAAVATHGIGVIRDIRMRTSKDFVHWDAPHILDYGPDAPDLELYTNNVQQYYRADHMFIGLPQRYIDRYREPESYPHLPDWKHRQYYLKYFPRIGTAMTDVAVMTSRDGLHFRRTEEAFLTTGIERGTNWYYSDCKICYGMAETASDIPGAPHEISLYLPVNYRVCPVQLFRYALRLDGFFSWRCDAKPGRVVTKPLIFDGDKLHINFATSAFGSVRIRILDADGTSIEGYDSGNHFGDSVDREIPFAKPLEDLAGKAVRLEISMYDADLYSFKFHNTPKIC